jgi:hypothetical protein
MKTFQNFMESALQSTERVDINEAAGDAAAFKERQKARQSAQISTAKSRASKYKSSGVRGADNKAKRRLNARNRKMVKAAGQLGSAAVSAVRAGVSKLKSMRKKDGDQA